MYITIGRLIKLGPDLRVLYSRTESMETPVHSSEKTNSCYIIVTCDEGKPKSYIGWTNNTRQRIKQHCQKICGGARATRGRQWQYAAILRGLPDKINAMQCEWAIKRASRGQKPQKRVNTLIELLQTEYWTSNSVYKNSEQNLKVHVLRRYAVDATPNIIVQDDIPY
jgi:predicted GIY-YIG superfamily endonuclease